MVKLLIFLFIIFKIIILSEIDGFEPVDLTIDSNLNNEVGKKGAVLFKVDYYYSEYNSDVDIKRETIFKMNIVNEKQTSYEVGCEPLIYNNRFIIFCELDDIPKSQYFFKFNEIFNYSKYEIHLTSNSAFNIAKIDTNKVDIYSGNQIISFKIL